MHWSGLASDFGKVIKTYQAHVITEMATLGLACGMISAFTQMEVTEVTRRGEKADYWLGDRELMSDLAHPQRPDRDSVGETAATFPQLECPCGTLCADDQESCLDRLILFGEGSLRKAIREFVAYYHLERNHQGLGNRLITPQAIPTDSNGTIQRRQRLGRMLNYYHRAA